MESTDIRVHQVPNLREEVQQIFEANGLRVEWIDQYSGKAIGSKISRVRGWPDLKYYEFYFQISMLQDHTAVIRVSKLNISEDKQYRKIVEDIQGTLQDIYEDMIKNKGSGDATKKNQVASQIQQVLQCPRCKAKVSEGYIFCPICGQELGITGDCGS